MNPMKPKPEQYRQGDVLLVATEPAAKKKIVKAEDGKLILARGEATGHHHSIAEQDGVLYENEHGLTELEIQAAVAPFIHPEHKEIALPKKTYRVVRQREYVPKARANEGRD